MNDIKLALLGSPGAGKSGGGHRRHGSARSHDFCILISDSVFYSDMLGCFIDR